jgi:hypothetical protein
VACLCIQFEFKLRAKFYSAASSSVLLHTNPAKPQSRPSQIRRAAHELSRPKSRSPKSTTRPLALLALNLLQPTCTEKQRRFLPTAQSICRIRTNPKKSANFLLDLSVLLYVHTPLVILYLHGQILLGAPHIQLKTCYHAQ